MVKEAWREFFDDEMTRNALNNSEVFRGYVRSELQREESREKIAAMRTVEEEARLERKIDEFQKHINSNEKLKVYLKKAKAALDADPELAKKVDQNFINGLKLLDFEE